MRAAREAGYRLLIALDVYIHHFGNRTFQQLGLDTRQRLEANFELFRTKWGPEYVAGYHLPPLLPPASEAAAEDAAADGGVPAVSGDGHSIGAVVAATPLADPIDSNIPVSLSMIVRNEEHHLPDCLRR